MILEIEKADWDKAVSRITRDDPDFAFDRTEPDTICSNCVLSVAAERLFNRPAYFLDELDIEGVGTFTGPKLQDFADDFDKHLMSGHAPPSSWPVLLEIELVPEEGR